MQSKTIVFTTILFLLIFVFSGSADSEADPDVSIIVNDDDGSPGYVEESGEWISTSGEANCPGVPNDGSRYSIQSSNPGAKATFTPDIIIEGYYLIEMAGPLTANASDHALYEIHYQGGLICDSVWIDQNTNYSCDWKELGIYPLLAGNDNRVSVINDGTGSGYILRADLMKFTFMYPVPVTLSSFQANGEPGRIVLDWVTASEINCQQWQAYRSDKEDGEYIKIGALSGHHSTESEHAYRWVDRRVAEGGEYFYKLKQVDFDGSVWWSQVVSATPGTSVPQTYALHQNYPNPFNAATEIRYQIPEDGHVTLKIFNTLGQEVRTLVDGRQQAGEYMIRWDGCDTGGRQVASGLYFCRMRAGGMIKTIKMVLLK